MLGFAMKLLDVLFHQGIINKIFMSVHKSNNYETQIWWIFLVLVLALNAISAVYFWIYLVVFWITYTSYCQNQSCNNSLCVSWNCCYFIDTQCLLLWFSFNLDFWIETDFLFINILTTIQILIANISNRKYIWLVLR